MSKVLRASATVLVFVAAAAILQAWVYAPYTHNRILKSALYAPPTTASALRDNLALIDALKPWDPFLGGWTELARARTLRKLGRNAEAREEYERALSQGLPYQFLVELGLYEWELGLKEEARSTLRLAEQLHESLLLQIEDPDLRAEVLELIR